MKQETDKVKEENVILMEESEDVGAFFEIEEVIYLESSLADFSTNIFVLIDNVGSVRMKAHYICRIQGVDGGELDMTGLRTTNRAKPKFVSVSHSESQESPNRILEVGKKYCF
ncbi:hypothetical protein AVEN_253717-1 [Araneus ventricosus]|uniref:Uncharacterized protein n=1 Tax=Araneus ventricosus TaxID=182803 RepID=A0A4Y2DZ56_ARAVE|nr:hypothetical protein AVEN_253717-1 [Araneus ventricosus]